MKTKLSFLILFYLLSNLFQNPAYSQCQADWQWTKGIKGNGDDYTRAMAVDKWNNIYIAGESKSSKLIIDSLTMTTGNVDYFIKFNSTGKLLWAKKISGANIYGIVTDKYGNVYIAGLFWAGSVTFDQVSLVKTANNNFNTFLVKYSPDGKALWGKKAYITQNGTILMNQGVSIDTASGNVVLSGSFSGDYIKSDNVNIPHNTKTSYSLTHAFFIVYDSTGNTKWGKSIYSNVMNVYGNSIASDINGNIYMGGYFVSDLQADTFHRVGTNESNMYVIKYDSKGIIKWIKNSSKGYVFADYLQVDLLGNIIVCGSMAYPLIKIENYTYAGLSGRAGMIMKVDSNGNIKWIKRIMGSYPSTTMKDGEQYVFSTANDAAGNIYAVGIYRMDSLIIDNHHFSKTGGGASRNPPFYIKLDKDGNFKWLQSVSLTDTSHASASFLNDIESRVVVDKLGQVYVLNSWSYYTYDPGTGKEIIAGHGIIVGKDTIKRTAGGTYDVFVGKIRNEFETTIKGGNVTCHGTNNGSANLHIIGGIAPYTIKWNNSSNQQELKNLSPGWYKVTVSDANNCTVKDSIEIKEPPQLYFSITTKPDSAGQHKGEATANLSGGTPPYTCLWNDASAQRTAKASALGKGSYKLTVTDKNGCISDTTIIISDQTGIDELFGTKVLVYPNPVFDGQLNIDIKQLPNDLTISLYDNIGREIISKVVPSGSNYHDRLSLPAKGVYILKLEMAGKVYSKNVVVQ